MKMFNVGKIINTHGVRGEVKVLRISDFDDRFVVGNVLQLIRGNEAAREVTIKSHRIHKGFDLITFKEIENLTEAETYKNSYLKITEDQLTDLEEDEFYYHEIIGCEVFTITNERIGKIKEILSPGANDVWVIQRDKQKDALIPFIEDIVKNVNIDEKKVIIEPMEGLLD